MTGLPLAALWTKGWVLCLCHLEYFCLKARCQRHPT